MAILCALTALKCHAQEGASTSTSTVATPSLTAGAKEIYTVAKNWVSTNEISHATNWTAAPYITYFPNDHGAAQFGGGIFVSYKINSVLNAGLGLDWLGRLTMPSGNVSLKYPIHPLASFGMEKLTVIPFAIAGIATPIGGAGNDNGTLATILGLGATIPIAHTKLFGRETDIAIGGALVKWNNAGKYDGNHYEGFLKATF